MKSSGKTRVVVICGPTAAGKSAVAIELARRFGAEIVGADSGQVYRGFDIGTAKPADAERQGVSHHLIDVVNPDQQFDAAQFRALAEKTIDVLARRGRPVFVVGGTGLYLKALLEGLFSGVGRDEGYRRKLRALLKREGVEAWHRRLAEVDPAAARHIQPTDSTRLERALEVFQQTGKSILEHQREHHLEADGHRLYDTLEIGLALERTALYERIERRILDMVTLGWRDEVVRLREQWGEAIPGFTLIGYRELLEHLQGRYTFPEAVRLIQQKTRNYAKRQLTWFRREERVVWHTPTEVPVLTEKIARFLDRSA